MLQLRSNQLTSLAGIEKFQNLKHLFLAANQITSLEGISTLDNLEILHLRNNQISSFENHFQAGKNNNLKYINFRANNISDFSEIGKLDILSGLKCVNFLDNPVVEEQDYRIEVLVSIRKLEKLDKDPFDEEEVEMAQEKFDLAQQALAEESAEAEDWN